MLKKTTLILLLVTLIMIGVANAGIHGLTHHSRANCGNNETISWQLDHSYWFWLVSRHRGNGEDHQVVMDWQYTWRAAAVHWGEGRGGWSVEGHHWMKDSYNRPVEVAQEYVTDCSIYDGWWG